MTATAATATALHDELMAHHPWMAHREHITRDAFAAYAARADDPRARLAARAFMRVPSALYDLYASPRMVVPLHSLLRSLDGSIPVAHIWEACEAIGGEIVRSGNGYAYVWGAHLGWHYDGDRLRISDGSELIDFESCYPISPAPHTEQLARFDMRELAV